MAGDLFQYAVGGCALNVPIRLFGIYLVLVLLAGCNTEIRTNAATDGRSDTATDNATVAAVAAAEARARAAEGGMSKADAAAAQARADALAKAAEAEDARQAKLRAEDESRTERGRAAAIAEDRARLGWWATAAGITLLVLAAGASVLGWWYGLGKLTQGIGAACAAAGGAALLLGLSWGWLPILAGVVIVGGSLVLLLRKAAQSISNHAERMHRADPLAGGTEVKAISAVEQVEGGVWTAVQRLRGKPVNLDKLQRLLSTTGRG